MRCAQRGVPQSVRSRGCSQRVSRRRARENRWESNLFPRCPVRAAASEVEYTRGVQLAMEATVVQRWPRNWRQRLWTKVAGSRKRGALQQRQHFSQERFRVRSSWQQRSPQRRPSKVQECMSMSSVLADPVQKRLPEMVAAAGAVVQRPLPASVVFSQAAPLIGPRAVENVAA